MDVITPGTIGVLHKGVIIPELDEWLCKMHERYPEKLLVKRIPGNQIPANRNRCVREMWGEWVLFIDSDNVPDREALPRLLARNVPIVGAKVAERWSPFPIAATTLDEPCRKYTIATVPKMGLIQVRTVGMACTLIQREVFDAIEPPWFQGGQISPEFLQEDTHFCLRAGKVGIDVYLDCDVQAGHEVRGILWPGADGRRWVEWLGPTDHKEPLAPLGDLP